MEGCRCRDARLRTGRVITPRRDGVSSRSTNASSRSRGRGGASELRRRAHGPDFDRAVCGAGGEEDAVGTTEIAAVCAEDGGARGVSGIPAAVALTTCPPGFTPRVFRVTLVVLTTV